jgi:hypothetical protein
MSGAPADTARRVDVDLSYPLAAVGRPAVALAGQACSVTGRMTSRAACVAALHTSPSPKSGPHSSSATRSTRYAPCRRAGR